MRASQELQRALAGALNVPALAGISFYDGPAARARPPYLSIGRERTRFRGWKGGGTLEHRFTVSLFDQRQDHAAVKVLTGLVVDAVLKMPRQLDGVRLVALDLVGTDVKQGKNDWVQGAAEFRAISVEE